MYVAEGFNFANKKRACTILHKQSISSWISSKKKKSITLTSKITGTGTNTLHKQSISSWIRVACVYYRHYI